jgi:hypothetical protein
MEDENRREQELVSLFEELPFHEETSCLDIPQLTPLQITFSQIRFAPPTETAGDSDPPYSSSENSPSQSRRYVRAGLEMSFAEFHQNLALATTTEAATFDTAAAGFFRLKEKRDERRNPFLSEEEQVGLLTSSGD